MYGIGHALELELVFCTGLAILFNYKDLLEVMGYSQTSLLRISVRGDEHRLSHHSGCPRGYPSEGSYKWLFQSGAARTWNRIPICSFEAWGRPT